MTQPFSPVRGAIQPGKILYTGKESGESVGDGASHSSDTLSLGETIFPLVLERRLDFEENLTLAEFAAMMQTVALFQDEDLVLREAVTAFMNAGSFTGPERPVQAPSSTLTAGFGNGGFGQLGFGGTVSVTG